MFYEKIKNSLNESDVSSLYKNVMSKCFPKSEIVSPYNTDGVLNDKKENLKMLMEFKYNKDFRNKMEINDCLIQSLYYLKKFEDDGNRLPEIIFIGDINECFCIHTNDIVKYLDFEIDWKIAPSSAANKNPKLLKSMYENANIKPYVFYIDENFNFKEVVETIKNLRSNIKKLIRITEKNINNIFNIFIKGSLKSKMDANKKVSVFVNVLLYQDDNYLHPTRKNVLVTRSFGDVKIKSDFFISFFEHFDRNYSPAQKERLTAICDRLIEDTTRRFQGEFYTPTEWVDEAHKMIAAEFGEDWKSEYVVWDCYDEKTKTLTQNGWKYFKELNHFDKLYSLNPFTLKGEWVNIIDKQKIFYKGKMHHYKSKRLDLLVSPNHKMFANKRKRNDRKEKQPFFVSSNEMYNFIERGNRMRFYSSAKNKLINLNVKLNSFHQFIGFFIGDGGYFVDGDKNINALRIRLKKKRKIIYLEKLLNDMKVNYKIYYDEEYKTYRITDVNLLNYIVNNNLIGTFKKRIPFNIIDIKYYNSIYDGLINSDSYISNSNIRYYSANENLINDIDRLVIELGYTTKKSFRKRNLNGKLFDSWELTISKLNTKNVSKSNLFKVDYEGYIYDVTLETNHVFLVKRNNKTIFSGNCAWGTGNLTRDYSFKELYCSTLNQSDLDIGEMYNNNAVKFQFDFLNDNDLTLPDGLQKALSEGKKMIVFMNPPFGTSSNLIKGTSKKNIAKTKINELMNIEKLDRSSSQLYAQFLYKIMSYNSKNINICTFASPLYLTGQVFKKFRVIFFNKFEFKSGMLFSAGNFSNVKADWGISFSIFKNGKNNIKHNFEFTLKDIDDYGYIKDIGLKEIYNTDFIKPLNRWLKDDVKGIKTFDAPQLSSAINVKPKGYGRLAKNAMGYSVSSLNIPENNATFVSLFTSTFSSKNGFSIFESNYDKVVIGFTARKTIKSNWINQKDEYMVPNEKHPDYEQWNNDCIVYSLFNTSSQQSSLRNVDYKEKKWNIENQFFFMSNKQMRELADSNNNDELYQDTKAFPVDRFVYNKLKNTKLSTDAQELLDTAIKLTIKSFEYRQSLNEEYSEYNLNTWDAGWYQIKFILKNYLSDDLKAFNTLYKKFEARMSQGVYKFGFLR